MVWPTLFPWYIMIVALVTCIADIYGLDIILDVLGGTKYTQSIPLSYFRGPPPPPLASSPLLKNNLNNLLKVASYLRYRNALLKKPSSP